jgi:hypothetical protein
MTSLNLHHRVAPVSPSAWFAAAIPATMVSLIVAALAWSATGLSAVGGAVFVATALAGCLVARHSGNDKVLAYLGGAGVTLAGLFIAPLMVTQYLALS